MSDLLGDAAGVALALVILWLLLRLVLWTWRTNRRLAARHRRQAAYAAYMDSPEWQALRQEALERDGHRCRLCNARRGLEVHHRSYPAVMGTETVDALTTPCATPATRASPRCCAPGGAGDHAGWQQSVGQTDAHCGPSVRLRHSVHFAGSMT